jgi:hypothetical protein
MNSSVIDHIIIVYKTCHYNVATLRYGTPRLPSISSTVRAELRLRRTPLKMECYSCHFSL